MPLGPRWGCPGVISHLLAFVAAALKCSTSHPQAANKLPENCRWQKSPIIPHLPPKMFRMTSFGHVLQLPGPHRNGYHLARWGPETSAPESGGVVVCQPTRVLIAKQVNKAPPWSKAGPHHTVPQLSKGAREEPWTSEAPHVLSKQVPVETAWPLHTPALQAGGFRMTANSTSFLACDLGPVT